MNRRTPNFEVLCFQHFIIPAKGGRALIDVRYSIFFLEGGVDDVFISKKFCASRLRRQRVKA
jgi:hypothetical protein